MMRSSIFVILPRSCVLRLLVKDMKVVRNDFTLNDIMYDAVVQDTFFGGYLHCKVFRPPLDAKVGVSPDKTVSVEERKPLLLSPPNSGLKSTEVLLCSLTSS